MTTFPASAVAYGTWCFALLVVYLIYRTLTSRKAPYPPGPRPYPFIGNILDVPTTFQEKAFADLAKKYGQLSPLTASAELN
jgi:hypothetical protein